MRHLIATTLLLCSSFALAAEIRGSGKIIEQTRQVSDFTAIRSEGAYVLDVTAGAATSLKISGDDNFLPLLETSVSNGELQIRFKNGKDAVHFGSNSKLRITVTTPTLNRFSGEGAGKVMFHNLAGDSFTIAYQGAGLLTAGGQVKNLTVQADGAGSMDLKALKAANATVSLEGVGAINVHASESLTASVDGIGSLTYYGHPAKVSKSISGIGSFRAGD
ncbi:head GIN domain-containing protein [Chitinimonas sp.]|uniref:head GIN domain-containing protein n=1 Tax=Chitinimonas sp. TaxID=1934313 RepID=UPI0035B36BC4